ncbi:hypothetical protein [Bacillus sp. FJAT-49736]|uniref:hypothetical protein n=1 Tax=Bacillus sp. FJAT-49736 TaxID=2833582 RepID=UPI001BC963CA|nr:hypothetical protein [Bacillus sp. FJAT-49736]MBS4172109.1 hypothetical protein [Bacillus sp. FJAT-49736]
MDMNNGELIVDYSDLLDVQEMLHRGTDLKGCIETIFIINGQEPKYVQNVKISSEPNEHQRPFVEMVLKEINEYINNKRILAGGG